MRSPYRNKILYPVYAGQDHEQLDYYLSKRHRCWKMRYQKPGQLLVVKLFDQGRNREADYCAADQRVAREAAGRGMKLSHFELRK